MASVVFYRGIAWIQTDGQLEFADRVRQGLPAHERECVAVAEVGLIGRNRDRFGVGLFGFFVLARGAEELGKNARARECRIEHNRLAEQFETLAA